MRRVLFFERISWYHVSHQIVSCDSRVLHVKISFLVLICWLCCTIFFPLTHRDLRGGTGNAQFFARFWPNWRLRWFVSIKTIDTKAIWQRHKSQYLVYCKKLLGAAGRIDVPPNRRVCPLEAATPLELAHVWLRFASQNDHLSRQWLLTGNKINSGLSEPTDLGNKRLNAAGEDLSSAQTPRCSLWSLLVIRHELWVPFGLFRCKRLLNYGINMKVIGRLQERSSLLKKTADCRLWSSIFSGAFPLETLLASTGAVVPPPSCANNFWNRMFVWRGRWNIFSCYSQLKKKKKTNSERIWCDVSFVQSGWCTALCFHVESWNTIKGQNLEENAKKSLLFRFDGHSCTQTLKTISESGGVIWIEKGIVNAPALFSWCGVSGYGGCTLHQVASPSAFCSFDLISD